MLLKLDNQYKFANLIQVFGVWIIWQVTLRMQRCTQWTLVMLEYVETGQSKCPGGRVLMANIIGHNGISSFDCLRLMSGIQSCLLRKSTIPMTSCIINVGFPDCAAFYGKFILFIHNLYQIRMGWTHCIKTKLQTRSIAHIVLISYEIHDMYHLVYLRLYDLFLFSLLIALPPAW